MDRIFEGKVAIISGGLGDIGKATAVAFAQKGASIAIGDIQSSQKSEGIIRAIEKHNVKCLYHRVDVSKYDEVKKWVDAIEDVIGIPQFIIPNAATATMAGIHQVTPAQWQKEIDINLSGVFYLARETTVRLQSQKLQGRVVFVGSWAAHSVHSHMPAYSVSKAGVRMLCQCMAKELAPQNILVNEIAPGYVKAGLSGKIWKENPGMEQESLQRVPVRRLITAAEVAEQIIYLCRPDNQHMTGSTLLMDGGLSL